MNELERHIEILLLSNDCVIVPGLGGFMAHHVHARYDEQDGMYVPPIRTLGFNQQLKLNDSLLVQSYIETYDISYPEALRRVESEVAELRAHLETKGSYELNGIGVLTLNSEGNMEFEPCEAGILTPELYGLSSIEMKPLGAVAKDEEVQPEAQTVPEENAITIKMSWLRNAVAVAAAIIAFFMIGAPVSNSIQSAEVQKSAFISVSPSHRPSAQQADSPSPAASEEEDLAGMPEMTFTENPTKAVDDGFFCIVMASQVTERNAKAFISQLEEKGFSDARILVSGSKKIRRVVYGEYESERDAASTLRQLRSESRLFKNTWIMEVKNGL